MLDLKLLQQALALAQHRNFARAARSLHMTQPALSRSIAGLEATLGERLFSRGPQGVEPTSFGRMLLARARTLVEGATELERDFRLMRGLNIGELRIGAGAYPAEMSVARAAGQLLKRHPELRIDIELGDLRELVAAVQAHRLDLAVIELSLVDGETRMATEALPRHDAVFYCRAGHPLVTEATVTIAHTLAFPLVGTRMPKRVARDFLEIARVGAIDPSSGDYLPPIKVDSLSAAREVVLRSDAVAAAPRAFIAAEIASGRLAELKLKLPWMHTNYGFVYLRDRVLSPAAEAFMAEVRTVEQELAAEENRSPVERETA